MKNWYASKMIWVNLIALAVIIIQTQYGYVTSLEIQGMILVLINVILRAVTHEDIVWSK